MGSLVGIFIFFSAHTTHSSVSLSLFHSLIHSKQPCTRWLGGGEYSVSRQSGEGKTKSGGKVGKFFLQPSPFPSFSSARTLLSRSAFAAFCFYVQNHFHTLSFPFIQMHRKISFISIFPETILKARSSRRLALAHGRHGSGSGTEKYISFSRVLSNFHNNSVRFEWLCKNIKNIKRYLFHYHNKYNFLFHFYFFTSKNVSSENESERSGRELGAGGEGEITAGQDAVRATFACIVGGERKSRNWIETGIRLESMEISDFLSTLMLLCVPCFSFTSLIAHSW